MNNEALIDAYRRASYEVYDAGCRVAVRVGQSSPPLDALLERHAATQGVFITAWNPRSQPAGAEANAAANDALAQAMAALGLRVLAHVGRDPDGRWSEEGYFVLALDARTALALAEQFQQNGVVHYPRGGPARLLLSMAFVREE